MEIQVLRLFDMFHGRNRFFEETSQRFKEYQPCGIAKKGNSIFDETRKITFSLTFSLLVNFEPAC